MTQPTVSTAEVCYIYMRQGGCVFVVVYLFDCLSVCLLATLNKNFRRDFHEIFMEGWLWANEQTVKFWWRIRSESVSRHW